MSRVNIGEVIYQVPTLQGLATLAVLRGRYNIQASQYCQIHDLVPKVRIAPAIGLPCAGRHCGELNGGLPGWIDSEHETGQWWAYRATGLNLFWPDVFASDEARRVANMVYNAQLDNLVIGRNTHVIAADKPYLVYYGILYSMTPSPNTTTIGDTIYFTGELAQRVADQLCMAGRRAVWEYILLQSPGAPAAKL